MYEIKHPIATTKKNIAKIFKKFLNDVPRELVLLHTNEKHDVKIAKMEP